MTDEEMNASDALLDAWEALEKLPPSREISLAKTKLEECRMWFGKAVPE